MVDTPLASVVVVPPMLMSIASPAWMVPPIETVPRATMSRLAALRTPVYGIVFAPIE